MDLNKQHNTEPIEFTIMDPDISDKMTELEYLIEDATDPLIKSEYQHELSVLQGISKGHIVKQETSYSHTCGIYFEHSVSCFGYSFLVIFGYHINGAYICIPNWSIGCEASDHLNAIEYNRANLKKAGAKPGVALAVASYIDKWILENQDEVGALRSQKDKSIIDGWKEKGYQVKEIYVEG